VHDPRRPEVALIAENAPQALTFGPVFVPPAIDGGENGFGRRPAIRSQRAFDGSGERTLPVDVALSDLRVRKL
jgi:hypothetical protein